MNKTLLLVLTVFLAANAYAGRCANCTVKAVGCSYKYNGVQSCNVITNEVISDKPSCANTDDRMVIDVSKEAGKAMLAVALSAQASGQKVQLYGASVCDVWSSNETANLIYIGEM
jgi:hypothetical protein